MQLIVLQYNNYLNRIIKHEDEIADYYDKAANSFIVNDYDFNPNDGVDTTAILGGEFYDYENSDYLIVIDQGEIASRWFILDARRTRRGQYSLTLHRDVCTDSLEDVINAPCFIEKAIPALNSKFVFNSENMTYNQIKQKEILLKDDTNIPWAIIYLEKDRKKSVDTDPDLIPVKFGETEVAYDYQASSSFASWTYHAYASSTTPFVASPNTIFYIKHRLDFSHMRVEGFNKERVVSKSDSFELIATNYVDIPTSRKDTFISTYINHYNDLNDTVPGCQSLANTKEFLSTFSTTPKIWKFSDGYKIISLKKLSNKVQSRSFAPTTMKDKFLSYLPDYATNIGNPYEFEYNAERYYLDATTYNPISTEITVQIPRTSITQDAGYDILAVPYGNFTGYSGDAPAYTHTENITKQFMQAVQTVTALKVIDVQILPYCPEPFVRNGGHLQISDTYISQYFFKTGGTNVGVCLGIKKASFGFNIKVTDTDLQPKSDVVEKKVQSETQFIRLNSPNYASSFQMGVAQNGGVSNIEVSCTYKPISPYIHLNPTWGELYGTTDFNDARGLICAGEFSADIVNNAWIEYQRNNKNYQASFDRQIQNMEVKNKYGHIQDIAGAIAGTVAGGVIGAGVGGVAGGIAGGIASGAAGVADVAINQKLRAEEMSYAKDQFGYQLGNIQALPQTLSRTTSYNIDNKYFPFIEIYDASDEEKEALRNKITYNGMTIGAISTISNFMKDEPTYIKGQIIRLENLGDDYHYARTIVDEINKGVYI